MISVRYTWKEVKVKGAKPSARCDYNINISICKLMRWRYGHTWTWVGGDLAPTLLMFGGTNGKEAYNQLWSFNLSNKSWKNLTSDKKSHITPAPRYFHSTLTLQGFLLVFGGRNNEDLAFNDFIKIPIRVNLLPMIPTEILMKVFEKLDMVSLVRANSVSKQWNQLTSDGYLVRYSIYCYTDLTNKFVLVARSACYGSWYVHLSKGDFSFMILSA